MDDDTRDESRPAPRWESRHEKQLDADAFHIWMPRPLLRSVRWQPDPSVPRDAASGSYEVFLTQAALREAHHHVWYAEGGVEPFGFLVGELCEDPETNRRYVIISGAVPCRLSFDERGERQISAEAEVALQLEVDRNRGVLVGWYHRHWKGPPALSDADVQTHKELFTEPWHSALLFVTDPAEPTGALFRRTSGGFDGSTPLPFYEMVSNESLMAKGVRRSWIDWRNVSTEGHILQHEPERPADLVPPLSEEDVAEAVLEAEALEEVDQDLLAEAPTAASSLDLEPSVEPGAIGAPEPEPEVTAPVEPVHRSSTFEVVPPPEHEPVSEILEATPPELPVEAESEPEPVEALEQPSDPPIEPEPELAELTDLEPGFEPEPLVNFEAESEAEPGFESEPLIDLEAEPVFEPEVEPEPLIDLESKPGLESPIELEPVGTDEEGEPESAAAEGALPGLASSALPEINRVPPPEPPPEERIEPAAIAEPPPGGNDLPEGMLAALKEVLAEVSEAETSQPAEEVEPEPVIEPELPEPAPAEVAPVAEAVEPLLEEPGTPPEKPAAAAKKPKKKKTGVSPLRRYGPAGLTVLVVAAVAASVWVITQRSPVVEPTSTNPNPTEITPPPAQAGGDPGTPVAGSGAVTGDTAIVDTATTTGAAAAGQPPATETITPEAFEDLRDGLLAAISSFYGRAVARDNGQASCTDLQNAFVAVEDAWITYNVEGKARLGGRLIGEDATRDERLYAGVQDVEREFDRSDCERP